MNLSNKNLFRQESYVNGQWIVSTTGKFLTVDNPFNGEAIGQIPMLEQADIRIAIARAHDAFSMWKTKTANERAVILHKWADLIEQNKQDLAIIMTLENGKSLAESVGEIGYGGSFIRWFAEEGKRTYGDIIPTIANDRRLLVIKQAIGVCAAITPWNFPSAMILRKCAPALAAGCTIVIKPSELTPFSALALMELASQAGFPDGVINVVTGDAVIIGDEFCHNKLVKKLSFTGSTRVGKLLMQQCSDTVKKLSLELGGNAPFIVFDDAIINDAVDGLMLAKFRNSGQTCVAANRVYVHESIYEQFVAKLVKKVKEIKVGNGLEKDINVGPLINQAAIQKVETLIKNALSNGAKVIHGGERHKSSKNAFSPTIIENLNELNSDICQTEIFGPVIALYRFKDEDEVINRANNTPFGLAAYFYGRDIGRVWRVAESLDYGMVSINKGIFSSEVAPFGGIKESGFGREGSKYGIEDFLQLKYLCMGF